MHSSRECGCKYSKSRVQKQNKFCFYRSRSAYMDSKWPNIETSSIFSEKFWYFKKMSYICNPKVNRIRSELLSRGCGEMVDTLLWGGSGRWPVGVRVSPSAQKDSFDWSCPFFISVPPRHPQSILLQFSTKVQWNLLHLKKPQRASRPAAVWCFTYSIFINLCFSLWHHISHYRAKT